MRKFLFTMVLLYGCAGFSGGKIDVQTNMYDNNEIKPSIGLGIYQPLVKKVAFNSWTGVGQQPLLLKEDVTWFVTKNQLDMHLKEWTVSPGLELKYTWPYKDMTQNYFIKISYKLWN